jgi:hypothetical protein
MENEFDGKEIPAEELLDAVKEASEILSILVKSKEEEKSIAISSLVLGEHFVVTAVEDIITENGETIVQLKPFDSSGYLLPQCRIRISDILAVCPFKSAFKNPVLKNYDRPRTWYF